MPSRPVIALVASAGGLDALEAVLGRLPADLAASVLVLVHQEPDHESRLAPLLGARSTLTVSAAEHGDHLRPGHVLVVPAGRHLLVTRDRSVALLPSGVYPPNRPSADLLLVSMALCLGADAIAVVLSGGGHDAATGAVAVHDFGGRVLVSDEASSQHTAMPLATLAREGAHAEAVPLSDIGDRLLALLADT